MLECFTCLPSEECYLNLPDDLVTDNPLDMENIKEKQDADNALQQHADKYSDRFLRRQIGTVDNILCYVKPGDPPNNWKIALPKELLQPTIQWFHQVTGHPGSKRLYKFIVGTIIEIYVLLLTNFTVNIVNVTSSVVKVTACHLNVRFIPYHSRNAMLT